MAKRRRALRQRRPRRFSPRIIIVGEGIKTEYNYFATLGPKYKRSGGPALMPHIPSRTGSAIAIVQSARRIVDNDQDFDRRRGDRCYCILDVEPHDDAKQANLREAISLANNNDIHILLSNPCFEVWLLSHVAKSGKMMRQFNDPTAVDIMLQQLTRKGKAEFNSDSRLFGNLLIPHVTQAVHVAKEVHTQLLRQQNDANSWVPPNASTDVYKLVAYVIGETDTPP